LKGSGYGVIDVLSKNLPEETEENHEKPQYGASRRALAECKLSESPLKKPAA
jgi:hypothetical protein